MQSTNESIPTPAQGTKKFLDHRAALLLESAQEACQRPFPLRTRTFQDGTTGALWQYLLQELTGKRRPLTRREATRALDALAKAGAVEVRPIVRPGFKSLAVVPLEGGEL